MIVLMCHIPFIFFACKEALLITIDEATRRSISNALWHKLQANEEFAKNPEHQEIPNDALPIPGDNTKQSFASHILRASDNGDRASGLAQSRVRSTAIMSHISTA